jgi:hypothetical protein
MRISELGCELKTLYEYEYLNNISTCHFSTVQYSTVQYIPSFVVCFRNVLYAKYSISTTRVATSTSYCSSMSTVVL